MVVRVCAASEDQLRLIAGLVVHRTESCPRDDDIAVLHYDGNAVRLSRGERPLCKGKPASFRLFPVSSYLVVAGAGSLLPALFRLAGIEYVVVTRLLDP